MPSHFWYLVERCTNMLSVVRVDSDRRRGIVARRPIEVSVAQLETEERTNYHKTERKEE